MAQLGRFLMAAWVAAPLGSLLGSSLLIASELARFYNLPDGTKLDPRAIVFIATLYFIFGALVSFVALLLVGIPLSWPFRRAIRRRPLLLALVYALLGALLGLWITVLIGLSDRETLAPAMVIGGATAAVWIWMIARSRVLAD